MSCENQNQTTIYDPYTCVERIVTEYDKCNCTVEKTDISECPEGKIIYTYKGQGQNIFPKVECITLFRTRKVV